MAVFAETVSVARFSIISTNPAGCVMDPIILLEASRIVINASEGEKTLNRTELLTVFAVVTETSSPVNLRTISTILECLSCKT